MKILHSGPTHEFVQFDCAGYTVKRSAQQAKLGAGKVHQNLLIEMLQQLRSFMLDNGNKLFSSVSEPSSTSYGVSRSEKYLARDATCSLLCLLMNN